MIEPEVAELLLTFDEEDLRGDAHKKGGSAPMPTRACSWIASRLSRTSRLWAGYRGWGHPERIRADRKNLSRTRRIPSFSLFRPALSPTLSG